MWIVCQIGAREHYSIARGLQRAGQLAALVTDFWVSPGSPASGLPGAHRLSDRFHADLGDAQAYAPNLRMLCFELLSRVQRHHGWDRMIARNSLFQQEALRVFPRIRSSIQDSDEPITLFSYSYAALELFREAKRLGWKTVLGQIDPGPGEDEIVRRLRIEHPEWAGDREASPPDGYWESWREECALADRIVVNSSWSRQLMIEAGIEESKIEIVPLAFEPEKVGRDRRARRLIASGVERQWEENEQGSEDKGQETGGSGRGSAAQSISPRSQNYDPRAFRILYLGQVIVRKGIQDLVAAAKMLGDLQVTFDVVGPHGVLPVGLPSNVVFHGQSNRSETSKWYAEADVFVLPTHSDGFAITQIEAMSHGVPVIATPCSGNVVENGVNGWQVPAGDPHALAACIRKIVTQPEGLNGERQAARKSAERFSIDAVTDLLIDAPRSP